MNITSILTDLRQRNITLRIKGNDLSVVAGKGVLSPETREILVNHKQAIVSYLRRLEPKQISEIQVVDRSSPLPLSSRQQRLWFLAQLEPASSAYVIPAGIRIRGPLQRSLLNQALKKVVDRHEVLRSVFKIEDGEPRQVILNEMDVPFSFIDLKHISSTDQETKLQECMRCEMSKPFDLSEGPLLRAVVLQLEEQDHVLFLALHQIVADVWSLPILVRELSAFYAASQNGRPADVTVLPLQYADYAAWQHRWNESVARDRQFAYWEKQLTSLVPLALPTDHSHQDGGSPCAGSSALAIPQQLVGALHSLALQHEATLFMVLLGAFQILLSRYSGQQRIAVGTPVANRKREGIEGLIGVFANTLVMCLQLEGTSTCRQLLSQIRKTTLDAFDNQELPFEELVDALQPERNLNRHPLVQAMFILRDNPRLELEVGEIKLQPFDVENPATRFDLTLSLLEEGAELRGWLNYNAELFEPATVARMIGHYCMLLQGIVERPDESIFTLPLLTPNEHHQLIEDWNQTGDEIPKRPFVDLFEENVQLNPAAVAVICSQARLSYRELNERANQLGWYLRDLGIGPDVLVGICVDRSVEMLVGLLGILKAGGAYLPLDSDYPMERLRYMIEDSRPVLLLTQESLQQRLADAGAQQVLCLDRDWEAIQKRPVTNLKRPDLAEDLAYTIYTSGSTGRPKGVMITRRSVTNFLHSMISVPGMQQDDVLAAVTTLSFDIAGLELCLPLIGGGCILLIDRETSRDGRELHQKLIQNSVTMMQATPSTWNMLFLDGWRPRPGFKILCGGEALNRELATKLIGSDVRVWNLYGPTETTIWSCVTQLKQSDAITIGKPIANTQVYILDEHLELTPIGVPGELYIGGDGLARGYASRPDLTAERFVPDHVSGRPGVRLYRTGDNARWRADGNVEYLGRFDDQVKIRGHRIELGEVEAVLMQSQSVERAVVVLREDQPGEKRLVAYVVQKPGTAELDVSGMRSYLQTRLPEYMVPSALVVLKSMPLTANGKLDRKALPRPELNKYEKKYVAPRNAVEEELSQIWEKVLRVKRVGIRDDFFELGGDSILSIQILARCREAGIKLELRQLFQKPTIEQLAPLATAMQDEEENAGTVEPFSLISAEDRGRLPQDVEDAYPLSRLQAGMLFHSEFNEETPLYHVIRSFHLRAPLDAKVLRQAVAEVVERHEILRTSFHISGHSEPLQWVHRRAEIEVEVEDLRHLREEAQEKILQGWIETEKRRRFDVSCAGSLRFHVHRRTDETFQFCMTHHHVNLDGWSGASLLTELFRCYFGLLKGGWEKRGRLSRHFREFVEAEMAVVKSEEARAFWAEQLRGMEIATLPWEKQRTTEGKMRTLAVTIGVETSKALNEWARQMRVSLKSVLLAAHVRVLSLISGQTDVITGITTDGRLERREMEQVLGLFLNTPPFRMKLRGGSWKDLVQETAEQEVALLPYRRYPLADIQMLVGRTSVFDVTFNFVHFHVYREIERIGGIKVLGGVPFDFTNFTLSADFFLDPALLTLQLTLEYNSLLLTKEQIQSIGSYYQNVLRHMVRYPDARYETTSLLSEAERQQLLTEWNKTALEYPKEAVVELFEQQANKTPAAVAVECANRQLTYAELNARANQLARYLENRRVGPETPVGVCMERSLEMFVALLGIMKAGAVYVPLDPGYPPARLTFIAQDAALKVTLIHDMTMDVAPQSLGRIVNLSRDLELISQEQESNLPAKNHPANLAYIIYTSGSTGKPKGVGISYGAVCNQLSWATRAFQVSATDRFLQKASISFDASIEEILTPLVAGARIIAAKPRGEYDVEYLAELVASQGVTCIDLPPSLLQAFIDYPDASLWSSVRLVITGGEVVKPELVKSFHKRFSSTLINTYGPTETTVQSTWADELQPSERVAIGRPVANTKLFVLDEHFEPVPVVTGGELCIGGAGLGRGYINRPALTAEKFIPDPFSAAGGERLYRTGDRVKWRNDGQLDFIGRMDHQVKLRGYRIELEEVENTIESETQVKQAVVVVREDQPGVQRLVGYITKASEGPILNTASLREYLKERLPDYMIPAVWVEMKEFPLTANGKIDRKALPEPGVQLANAEYMRPRNATEEILCGIWEELLKREGIGVSSSFFELGGHSLLATQVVARIGDALGVNLPVRRLFEAPTIGELAHVIEQMRAAGETEEIPAIVPVPRSQAIPLSFAQQRLWFLDQLQPGSSTYNFPLALRVSGGVRVEVVEQVLAQLTRRHEILRTTFSVEEGQAVQKVGPVAGISVLVKDLSGLAGESREAEARRLAQEEAEQPFNLSQGPLLRVKMLRLGEQEHVLLVTMHHIVTDGWSMEIMMREFSQLYVAYSKGEESFCLPELPVQYADFSVWQREWLQGAIVQKQVQYWKERLAGIQTLELPTDRQRPAVMSYGGAAMRFSVGFQQLQELKVMSRRGGATLYMSLLAAFQSLLHRYSGQEDVAVGTPIAGRRRAETEGLIGFFVNTLVLRTEVRGGLSFGELLRRVREVSLEAYSHQDVPFEKVVEEVQPERDLSRTPLFQVMFILQNMGNSEVQVGDIRLGPFEVESQTAKFDLTVSFTEGEGELQGWVSYNAELFEAATVSRMMGHYSRLLQGIVEHPEQAVWELPMLADSEREQLLVEWNNTRAEYDRKLVAEVIEEQVERMPEAAAVDYEGRKLTYAELNHRANQLARYLGKLGVGAEVRVGVCMERSLEMVVALLGIMKAGGAYVPLDPAYPAERLGFMAEEAQVGVILIEEELVARFPQPVATLVKMDTEWELIGRESGENLPVHVEPENLVYVIYTSGSTGRPKGAMNTHGGLRNRLLWMQERYGLGPSDRVLQKTPYSFDVSVWEFFWPLMVGAELVVARPGGHRDPQYVGSLIREKKVSTLHFVPSMLAAFLESGGGKNCESVRRVICSGEALGAELARRWREAVSGELHNLYGPTEASIDVTYWKYEAEETAGGVAIGKPIANTGIYILDGSGQPVPVLAAGEVYIAGSGLARGYVNRADLTAERFVPDHVSGRAGERLYRTGDKARWRRDGNLEYLGRFDDQVKIRGFRIELGEIETVLQEFAEVEQAVVICRTEGGEDKQLAAYVVCRKGTALDTATIRDQLRKKLPDYMIPAHFVLMESLPLTPSGKVNRRALPKPQPSLTNLHVAPRTALEQLLAEAWQQALSLDRVSLDDNFFDLGGHSLMVTRVRSVLGARLKREIPLMDFFTYPTIRSLARQLEQMEAKPVSISDSQERAARQKATLRARRQKA